MTSISALDWIARLTMSFYFLTAAWFNYRAWDHHVDELRRAGIGPAQPALVAGLITMTTGAVLLLIPRLVVLGVVVLIVFTLAASALFHQFWAHDVPKERRFHQLIFFENIAHVGALCAILALQIR